MAATNDERGWQVGRSLTDCLQHLLENEIGCDVTFEIQSAGNPHVNVSAHKMILQARSPVFEAMFSGAFVESEQNVIITDVQAEVFKTMLRFMYTDNVTLTGENVQHLLYASNKYILEGLSEKCKEFLSKQISVNNVCSILTCSLVYQDEDVVNTCMDLIAPNANAVSQTEAFYNMSHDALLKVASCDQLALGAEAELFEGCLEWGKRRVRDPANPGDQEIRELLGECLHKIRFPFIPLNQFGLKFGETSVLNGDEKSLIYSWNVTHKETYVQSLAALGFDIISRLICFKKYSYDKFADHKIVVSGPTEEDFTFWVNKQSQLTGFSVYGGAAGAQHDVSITVWNLEKPEEKYSTKSKITSKGNKTIPIYIRKMRIDANKKYQVCISLTGDQNTGYGYSPTQSTIVQNVTFSSSCTKYPCPLINGHQSGYVADVRFQLLPS